ncbi:2055_t:CDS:1 [Paraglomus occultum]|uniref:2055_t:CDS:1 n=1 Tax=Paraglomus occultum TaxID=144539 RepID=A0A9N9GCA2_9GLOM|nr:2055_t:CDS:1 [Paraglomus occultum]
MFATINCTRLLMVVAILVSMCIPSYAQGEAYLFNKRRAAAGFGHVAWGYMRGADYYTYGSLDSEGSVMTSRPNGFWDRSGSHQIMIATFKNLGYDTYIKVIVDAPSVENAIQTEEAVINTNYNLFTNDCMEVAHNILSAYNAALPTPFLDGLFPNVWYDDAASDWQCKPIPLQT